MKNVSLLPADTYIVVNKSIISEDDKKNVVTLYEPIIGPIAVALYFTLLRDIHLMEFMSNDYTHHHLMKIMKSTIEIIKIARESLEGVGLLKTYFKEGETNSYVYELYSPLSPKEFFASPIFNITLFNNLGKTEYELIKAEYELPKVDLKEYTDVSKELNNIYRSSSNIEPIESRERNSLNIKLESNIDFDLIMSSMPKGLLKEKSLTKKTKELIEQLAFIYDIDTLKMIELLRTVINDKGTFDKESLRLNARKYYQYNNSGQLPTLVYRTQPQHLISPEGDNSPLGKLLYVFEHTSPYDFLKMKNNGAKPTARDLKLIESLIIDLDLKPAVVNVLIDYALRKNDNKLKQAYVETIAGQWKRSNIETAKEAMELARKENNMEPVWLNKDINKEEMTEEEVSELEELLKDFG